MAEPTSIKLSNQSADLVLREIWQIKDQQSATRGHDVHRLFAEARARQQHSGRRVVNLQEAAAK